MAEGWPAHRKPEGKPKGVTAVAVRLPKDLVPDFTNEGPQTSASRKYANVPQPAHDHAQVTMED